MRATGARFGADIDVDLSSAALSDVSVAIDYLLRSFPHQPPIAHFIEPKLVLVNQLYAIVDDRTAVDRELAERASRGEIRLAVIPALGDSYYGFMAMADYADIVRSFIPSVRAEAVSEPKSILEPESRPIRRKRRRSISGSGGGSSGDLESKENDSEAMKSNQPNTSTITSSSSSSSSDDTEPSSTRSSPAPTPSRPPPPERVDEYYCWHVWLDHILPTHTQSIITHELLTRLLHYNFTTGDYDHHYAVLSDDQLLSLLFRDHLLSRSLSLSSPLALSYYILLPNVTHIITEILAARATIQSLIKQTRAREMLRGDLVRRVRVKGSERGMQWHLLEMLGTGLLQQMETTRGQCIRIHSIR